MFSISTCISSSIICACTEYCSYSLSSSTCDANSSLQMTSAWAQTGDTAALAVRTTGSLPVAAVFLKAVPFRQTAPLRGPVHELLRLQQWSSRPPDSSSQRPLSHCIVWSRLLKENVCVCVFVVVLPLKIAFVCVCVCVCPWYAQMVVLISGSVIICRLQRSVLLFTIDQFPTLFASYRKGLSDHL